MEETHDGGDLSLLDASLKSWGDGSGKTDLAQSKSQSKEHAKAPGSAPASQHEGGRTRLSCA